MSQPKSKPQPLQLILQPYSTPGQACGFSLWLGRRSDLEVKKSLPSAAMVP